MQLKKIIILIFWLTAFFSAQAQFNTIDSLKTLFSNTKDDSTRVVLLCQISDEFSLPHPDSAMIYAEQGLNLANQNGLKKGQARSLTRIGNILLSIGDFTNAFGTHLKSLKISEEIDDKDGIAATNSNMARVFTEQGDYRHALEYYFKAQKNYELILKNLENEKPVNEPLIKRNKSYLVIVSLNIGDNYDRMSLLDSALLFQSRAQSQAIMIDDKDDLGAILNNLGYIYFEKGMHQEALLSYKLSIPYSVSIDDKIFLANTYLGIARVFQKTGPFDTSIFYAQKSFSAASDGNFQKEMLNAANLLTELYESINDEKNALHYLKLAKTTGDSLFTLAKINQLYSLSINEKFRQQEITEAKEKAVKERKNNLQNLAFIILAIPFFGILFNIIRRKTHATTLESMGLLGLLLLFEFLSIFLRPYIGRITNGTPVYSLLINVLIALLMLPVYYGIRSWITMYVDIRNAKHASEEKQPAKRAVRKNK